jgi:hypothetical protein
MAVDGLSDISTNDAQIIPAYIYHHCTFIKQSKQHRIFPLFYAVPSLVSKVNASNVPTHNANIVLLYAELENNYYCNIELFIVIISVSIIAKLALNLGHKINDPIIPRNILIVYPL